MVLFKGGADGLDPLNNLWHSTRYWGLPSFRRTFGLGRCSLGFCVFWLEELERRTGHMDLISLFIRAYNIFQLCVALRLKTRVQSMSKDPVLIDVFKISWLPQDQPFHLRFTQPEHFHCYSDVAYWVLAWIFQIHFPRIYDYTDFIDLCFIQRWNLCAWLHFPSSPWSPADPRYCLHSTSRVFDSAQMSSTMRFITFLKTNFPCILVKLLLPEPLCYCVRLQGGTLGQLLFCHCFAAILCLCFPTPYILSVADRFTWVFSLGTLNIT